MYISKFFGVKYHGNIWFSVVLSFNRAIHCYITIGTPHVILKIYEVYPYTIVYSIGVDLIYF